MVMGGGTFAACHFESACRKMSIFASTSDRGLVVGAARSSSRFPLIAATDFSLTCL